MTRSEFSYTLSSVENGLVQNPFLFIDDAERFQVLLEVLVGLDKTGKSSIAHIEIVLLLCRSQRKFQLTSSRPDFCGGLQTQFKSHGAR